MVSEIVMSVLSDNSNRHITIQAPVPEKGKGKKPLPHPINRKRTEEKSAAEVCNEENGAGSR